VAKAMAAVHSSASDRAHRTEIWRFLAGQREQPLLPLVGIAVLGVVFGSVIATTELNALYLCAAVIGCAFILYDFRIGVVLLILLMPVSGSVVFPHEMFGVTGINPLNLLLLLRSALICCAGCSTAASGTSCRSRSCGSMSCRSLSPALWVHAMSTTSRLCSTCARCSSSTTRPGYLRDWCSTAIARPVCIVDGRRRWRGQPGPSGFWRRH